MKAKMIKRKMPRNAKSPEAAVESSEFEESIIL
jgi:hypothetical protein